jgi:hypothetical protein
MSLSRHRREFRLLPSTEECLYVELTVCRMTGLAEIEKNRLGLVRIMA